MQPPSLKSAASEIVFRMFNKEKLRLDLVSSCRPFGIDSDFHSEFDIRLKLFEQRLGSPSHQPDY